jgi:PPOX class probable F420-dependent enzyme
MAEIPPIYMDLLLEKKPLAHLATVMPDGSPQNRPVWFDYVDGKIRVNSALGRTKVRNMKLGAKVALSISDPGNPDRYVQLRGTVSIQVHGTRQESVCQSRRCPRDVRDLPILRPRHELKPHDASPPALSANPAAAASSCRRAARRAFSASAR